MLCFVVLCPILLCCVVLCCVVLCCVVAQVWKWCTICCTTLACLHCLDPQHNTTQHNTTQHNTTQHITTQAKTRQRITTPHNTTLHNTTLHPRLQVLAGVGTGGCGGIFHLCVGAVLAQHSRGYFSPLCRPAVLTRLFSEPPKHKREYFGYMLPGVLHWGGPICSSGPDAYSAQPSPTTSANLYYYNLPLLLIVGYGGKGNIALAPMVITKWRLGCMYPSDPFKMVVARGIGLPTPHPTLYYASNTFAYEFPITTMQDAFRRCIKSSNFMPLGSTFQFMNFCFTNQRVYIIRHMCDFLRMSFQLLLNPLKLFAMSFNLLCQHLHLRIFNTLTLRTVVRRRHRSRCRWRNIHHHISGVHRFNCTTSRGGRHSTKNKLCTNGIFFLLKANNNRLIPRVRRRPVKKPTKAHQFRS